MMLFFLVFTLLVTVRSVSSSFENCSTNFLTLQNALYDDEGLNIFRLSGIFQPPGSQALKFIKVTYSFFNESDQLDGCNVTYVWTIGQIVFFQPPNLFKLTSLHSNFPDNDFKVLHIQLPYECRGLVNTSGGDCSCAGGFSPQLETLTQLINIYAQYTDTSNLVKEDNLAIAVCSSDLQSFSHSIGISYVTLCITVFIPLGLIVILLITFRNLHKSIVNFIIEPSQQAGLVAYIVIGVYVSFGIFIFDILACEVVSTSNHELADDIDKTSITLQITYVTLFFDSLPFLAQIVCISCIFYHSIKVFFGIQNRQSKPTIYILKVISLVIGNKNMINFKDISDSNIIAVIFPFMLIPPIISLSSHVGYIFLAWLADPAKASAILLLAYAMLLSLFYPFKYIYSSYSSMSISVMDPKAGAQEIGNSNRLEFQDASQSADGPGRDEGDEQLHTTKLCRMCYVSPRKSKQINTQAFCLVLFHSVFIIGLMLMLLVMLMRIPFAAEEFTSYVINILQLLFLIISTQIALRVFSDETFDPVKFIATLKEALVKNKETNPNIKSVTQVDKHESVKVAGVIAAELTSAILHKVQESPNSRQSAC